MSYVTQGRLKYIYCCPWACKVFIGFFLQCTTRKAWHGTLEDPNAFSLVLPDPLLCVSADDKLRDGGEGRWRFFKVLSCYCILYTENITEPFYVTWRAEHSQCSVLGRFMP
jgi:hypothetical protein